MTQVNVPVKVDALPPKTRTHESAKAKIVDELLAEDKSLEELLGVAKAGDSQSEDSDE